MRENKHANSVARSVHSYKLTGATKHFGGKMNKTLYNYAESLDEELPKQYKKKLCLIGIAVNYMEEELIVLRDHLFCISGGNK